MWEAYPDLSKSEIRNFKAAYKQKARFLVDENMGNEVAVILRQYRFNTKYVDDVGLTGKTDEAVFAFAWKTKRIILTHDRGFLNDHKFPFHRNLGIVVMPGGEGDGTLEPALADLIILLAPYGRAHVGTKVEITRDRVWTIRGFLKDEGRHFKRRIKLGRNGEVYEWRG